VISRDLRIRSRTILLVDMDSFFSSVETAGRLELVGLPVVVGADPKEGAGRGKLSAHVHTKPESTRFIQGC
jgi:hypothetical protein